VPRWTGRSHTVSVTPGRADQISTFRARFPCGPSSTSNVTRWLTCGRPIFREKASGKDVKGRPQLEKAIDELGTGDVLVVAEWDRATRSMMDGVHLIERIKNAVP